MEIFTLGGAVFLVSFVLFKVSAFRKTKANETWTKLALVGVVDYLVLVAGTLGTGILFMTIYSICLLYTSPSPRDATLSRMPSSA